MTKSERRANQKKETTRYGLRWIVEIVISSFKRILGESVRTFSPRTASIEIATKIAAYNRNLDIGNEAVRAVSDSTNDDSSGDVAEITCRCAGIAA